jgi:hypothetical protein
MRPPGDTPWRWLDDDEHPFPFPVLDMRNLAVGGKSAPGDPEVRERFAALREAPATPWPGGTNVPGSLDFPAPEGTLEGALFRAASFEEKWDLDVHGDRFTARRSWTGEPVFAARMAVHGDTLLLDELQVRGDWDPALAPRHLDFLVWTHLFGRPVPHPVPDGGLADASAAARWSFGCHGRFAWFATEGDFSPWLRRER